MKQAVLQTTVGQIDARALAYTAGRDAELDMAILEADCQGTAAHVIMLSRMKIKPPVVTTAEARRVIGELARIAGLARKGRFPIRLADQDAHLAVERELTRRLGDLGKKVHTGRSRNDQVAVDLRLFAKVRLLEVMRETARLADLWLRFAARHRRLPMVGRTHMQPAMPSSVGLWASAWTESLLEDLSLLQCAADLNDRSPLGSAAGYGVPLPVDRRLTAGLLGFREPVHNVLHAGNARGKLESVILSATHQVMLSLSRMAQDMIVFTMPEFGYFTLPRELCTGSSIMPQKNNPDVLELVRARAASSGACLSRVLEVVRALPGGYNRDVQEAKAPFMEGLEMACSSVCVMQAIVRGLKPAPAALRAAFTPAVFATDHALELVANGMPFRDAYKHVKANLDELRRQSPDLALEKKFSPGASAGLDFTLLGSRLRAVAARVRRDAGRHERAMAALFAPAPDSKAKPKR